MIEPILEDAFSEQIRSTSEAVDRLRRELTAEADPEKSLSLREQVRGTEAFLAAVKSGLTAIAIADAQLLSEYKKFLKWRLAFFARLEVADEREVLEAKLRAARKAVDDAQTIAQIAAAAVSDFPPLDFSTHPTEPAKEAHRIAHAKLEAVSSEAQAVRNGLQSTAAALLRRWLDAGQRFAAAEFHESQLRPREPIAEQNSPGSLHAVR
jgi:hypothetical protein